MSPALWVAVLLIVVSVPMALGKVPPNGLYGFRTPKTMSSPEVWYPANRLAGINMIAAGVVSLAAWAMLRALLGPRQANAIGMIVDVVLVSGAGIVSMVQLRRL